MGRKIWLAWMEAIVRIEIFNVDISVAKKRVFGVPAGPFNSREWRR